MASASLNQTTLIGRIGRDPETRYTAGGMACCSFSVATTDSRKDKKTGEWKEDTDWHKIQMFGKVAEHAQKYASKGREVFIQGKLKTRKWTDKEGKDHYVTEILVNEFDGFKLLGSKPQGAAQGDNPAPSQPSQPSKPDSSGGGGGNQGPDSFPFDENDIPFVFADIGMPVIGNKRLRNHR